MCRLVAYFGSPVSLASVVCAPSHSLLHQSQCAHEARTTTHGDGFGLGWYGEGPEPGLVREVTPAWADENLQSICATVRSRLFFAHVRAATGTPTSRQNCHPFRHGRWMFMHNGQIGGYARVRRTLEAMLPDALYAARKGSTDSELLFLLMLARIDAGEPVESAVQSVLGHTLTEMVKAGVEEPLRVTALLTDGEYVHAVRYASDGCAPTLYVGANGDGQILASEPLDGNHEHWQPVPDHGGLRLSLAGRADDNPPLGELLPGLMSKLAAR